MRTWHKGVLVGEIDPPRDFEQWLRGEVAQAAQIKTETPIGGDGRASNAAVHARRACLQEVLHAFNDSRRSDVISN